MQIDDVVRYAYKCDQTFIDAIIKNGQPGDIILSLTSSEKDAIVFYQNSVGYTSPATLVRHVALYAGGGLVIHAIPGNFKKSGGVLKEPLDNAFRGKDIVLIRYRLLCQVGSQEITKNIALKAEEFMIKKYGYKSIFDMIMHWVELNIDRLIQIINLGKRQSISKGKINDLRGKIYSDSLICSEFVFACYDAIFKKDNPLNDPKYTKSPFRIPAEYYVNTDFLSAKLIGSELKFV